jgi:hypothetical protein
MMDALDQAFASLSVAVPEFSNNWGKTFPDTKTLVSQSPMLGTGPAGHDKGGFHLFAQRYAQAEGKSAAARCNYTRYHDFAFYADRDWYNGKKLPILIAECESKYEELLGELSGLLKVRSPFKYLFIEGSDTLKRLNDFCQHPCSCAVDWANTTYYVIEIPISASPPSTWTAFTATVEHHGETLRFRPAEDRSHRPTPVAG